MKRSDMKVGQTLALVRNPKGDLFDRKPRKVVLVDLVAPGRFIGAGRSNSKVLVRHAGKPTDSPGVPVLLANLFPDFDKCLAEHEARIAQSNAAQVEREQAEQAAEARVLAIMHRFAKLFDGVVDDYPRVYEKVPPNLRGAMMIAAKFRDQEVEVSVDTMEKILDRIERT